MTSTSRSGAFRLALVLGAVWLVPAIAAPSASAQTTEYVPGPGDVFPFPFQSFVLANGLRVYFIDAGALGQVAYVTIARTGSRDEVEEGKTGFAHFFEHVMFRGTRKYPDYNGETARMGAHENAFTSEDDTVYFLVVSSGYLARVVDLESDRFINLHYSEGDFRTEAGAVLGEYMQDLASPFTVLEETVRDVAFDVHPYKHTVAGFERDVRAMPEGYEFSLRFHDRFYRPENCVLILAGDFDRAEARRLIEEHYGGWERGYDPPDIPREPEQKETRRKTVPFPGRTLPILSISYKGPAWSATDPQTVALTVLGQLAFGTNSDLYRRMVLRERSAQSLRMEFDLSRDPGLVSVTAEVPQTDSVEAVEREIEATVARFREELVDARTLDDVKSHLRYGYLMRLETALSAAFSGIRPIVSTGRLETVNEYYATLQRVTPEDVRAAARRWLEDGRKTVVTLVEEEARS
jgi:zinc protease